MPEKVSPARTKKNLPIVKNPLIVKREMLGLSRRDLAAEAKVGYDTASNVELGYAKNIPPPILAVLAPYLPGIGTTPEALQEEYKAWRTTLGSDALRRMDRFIQAKTLHPGLEVSPMNEEVIDALLAETNPAAVSRPPNPPPPATVELSKSERMLIAAYCEGGGMAQVGRRWAELRGGKPYKTSLAACNSASRGLVAIKRRLAAAGAGELWFEWAGLTGEKIIRVLTEAFEADRFEPATVRRDRVVTLENGGQKTIRDDEVRIVRVGPDHRTRVDAAVRASALRGELYASRRNEASAEDAGRPTINVVIRSFAVNNTQFNQPALAAENQKEE